MRIATRRSSVTVSTRRCRSKRRIFRSSSIHPPRRTRSARSRTASRTSWTIFATRCRDRRREHRLEAGRSHGRRRYGLRFQGLDDLSAVAQGRADVQGDRNVARRAEPRRGANRHSGRQIHRRADRCGRGRPLRFVARRRVWADHARPPRRGRLARRIDRRRASVPRFRQRDRHRSARRGDRLRPNGVDAFAAVLRRRRRRARNRYPSEGDRQRRHVAVHVVGSAGAQR